MTPTTSSLKDKLKQYSLLEAPLLATTGMTNAQVMYQDINPDGFYKDAVMGITIPIRFPSTLTMTESLICSFQYVIGMIATSPKKTYYR
ncbi:MAG: hypothetical protein ABIO46_01995 [Chitinophagales bacterium]